MWNKRGLWAVVSFLGLAILIAMGWLSHKGSMEFDFVSAWAALMTFALTIYSTVKSIKNYDNATHEKKDSNRLSGARRDKLSDLAAEIMEKTHQVHRAVKSIAHDVSLEEEFKRAKEYYNIDINNQHNRNGTVFSYRLTQYSALFSEYRELDIKANTYFGEDVSNIIKDLTDVVDSVGNDIGKINFSSSSGANMTQGDLDKISKAEHAIWYLYTERVLPQEKYRDEEAEERLRLFQSIPERIDNALLKYTRNE